MRQKTNKNGRCPVRKAAGNDFVEAGTTTSDGFHLATPRPMVSSSPDAPAREPQRWVSSIVHTFYDASQELTVLSTPNNTTQKQVNDAAQILFESSHLDPPQTSNNREGIAKAFTSTNTFTHA